MAVKSLTKILNVQEWSIANHVGREFTLILGWSREREERFLKIPHYATIANNPWCAAVKLFMRIIIF